MQLRLLGILFALVSPFSAIGQDVVQSPDDLDNILITFSQVDGSLRGTIRQSYLLRPNGVVEGLWSEETWWGWVESYVPLSGGTFQYRRLNDLRQAELILKLGDEGPVRRVLDFSSSSRAMVVNGDRFSPMSMEIHPISRNRSIHNVSLRCSLPAGGSAHAGVVLDENETYLIRVIGPSLEAFGVENPLSHPLLSIHRNGRADDEFGFRAGRVAADQVARRAARLVGAFPLGETGGDVALIGRLYRGIYTFQATNPTDDEGEVLIELYPLPF